MRRLSLLTTMSLVSASLASAQSTKPEPDINSLHRAVFELPASRDLPDGETVLALARLYLEGKGVPQEPVLNCTLVDLHARARLNEPRGFEGLRLQQMADEMRSRYCDRLSEKEQEWALGMLGCTVFGLTRGTVAQVGPTWWVEYLAGKVFRVEFEGKPHEVILSGPDLLCPASQVVLFRQTTLDTAGRAGRSRSFLEIAAWRTGRYESAGKRIFTWHAYELNRGTLLFAAEEEMTEPGSIWPTPPSRGSDGAQFTALESGDVEYQITLDSPRRGRIGKSP